MRKRTTSGADSLFTEASAPCVSRVHAKKVQVEAENVSAAKVVKAWTATMGEKLVKPKYLTAENARPSYRNSGPTVQKVITQPNVKIASSQAAGTRSLQRAELEIDCAGKSLSDWRRLAF